MLNLLQGRTHQVITGVCIIYQDEAKTFAEVTEVTFAPMPMEEIQDYIKKENVLDKAGAYAIQGMAGRYITSIKGEYYNVVGLPIANLYQSLKERLKEYDLCALSLSEVERSEPR
jgi:septum formation protein